MGEAPREQRPHSHAAGGGHPVGAPFFVPVTVTGKDAPPHLCKLIFKHKGKRLGGSGYSLVRNTRKKISLTLAGGAYFFSVPERDDDSRDRNNNRNHCNDRRNNVNHGHRPPLRESLPECRPRRFLGEVQTMPDVLSTCRFLLKNRFKMDRRFRKRKIHESGPITTFGSSMAL